MLVKGGEKKIFELQTGWDHISIRFLGKGSAESGFNHWHCRTKPFIL